jgi:hypothetical protein
MSLRDSQDVIAFEIDRQTGHLRDSQDAIIFEIDPPNTQVPMIIYPLSIPGVLGESAANLKMYDAIGEVISPFSGNAQQQQWQDQHWELDLEFPEMTWAQFAAFQAFLGALHGKLGSFLWGPPLSLAPLGTGGGAPAVSTPITSAGPNPAGLGASPGSSGLVVGWSNPTNIEGTGGYASVVVPPGYSSASLTGTQFSFSLPSQTQIAGILVTATAYASTAGLTLNAQMTSASQGSLIRTASLPASSGPISFGASGDLWGTLPWFPATADETVFGVEFTAGGAGTFNIQNVKIAIYLAPSNQPGNNLIQTNGWPANQAGVLLPGDFLSITETVPRLYQYIGQVPLATDGSGNALIDVFPSVREALGVGALVNVYGPQGTFRLAENLRQAPARKTKTFVFKMKCREAI